MRLQPGTLTSNEETDNPPPGVVRWLIACDETGMHGARFYGFGTLFMAWQRRGDFSALIRDLRDRHPEHQHTELKWTHVTARTLPTYFDLVDLFFRNPWLSFQCLLVEKAVVRKELHKGDWDLARRKHLTMLLTRKMRDCLRAHRKREQEFRVWIDPIASRYAKADEVVEIVSNFFLAKLFKGLRPLDSVLTKDSRATPLIQLCDVLLGAVATAWQGKPTGVPQLELQKEVARHLGWPDLHADTRPTERKLNVWVFYDPTRGPRKVRTRDVQLLYPLPVRRRR